MANGNNLDLNIVVSGADTPVKVSRNQRVEQLMREALREAKQPVTDPTGWDLRFESGALVDRGKRIGEAGISDRMTLYLDPKEGGGGNAPTLVDPEISRGKLEAQLSSWRDNAESYRRRGWLLLDHRDLQVEVAFAARVPITTPQATLLPVAIRLDFANYDVWAPSLTFIDALTGEPAFPASKAINFRPGGQPLAPGELAEESLLPEHPVTDLPFLCQQGIREYHEHPQHDGDDWLLHRHRGLGTLASICTLVWRLMTLNTIGLSANVVLGPELGIGQIQFSLVQGDRDEIRARQLQQGLPVPPLIGA